MAGAFSRLSKMGASSCMTSMLLYTRCFRCMEFSSDASSLLIGSINNVVFSDWIIPSWKKETQSGYVQIYAKFSPSSQTDVCKEVSHFWLNLFTYLWTFTQDSLFSYQNEGPAFLAKHLQRSFMELAVISNFRQYPTGGSNSGWTP